MLQESEGITTGRLDTRYQGPDYNPLSSDADYDPQSNAISSAYTTAINQYLRADLKYGENWTYKPSAYGEPGFKWPFRYGEGGPNVMPDLAKTMKANPKTKVLLAGGYYDLATPYFEGKFEMHHLPIPQSLQANISYKYYQAGHMIYVNDGILKQFHDDVAAFIKGTEAAK
jgi:carboxypeptidase C (cathepsin A)